MSKVNYELQKIVEDIFNFAYANSNIKIPAATCKEVGKILHVGMFLEEIEDQKPAFSYSPQVLKKLNGSRTHESVEVAKKIKSSYKKMNRAWKIYDDSNIGFDDISISYIAGKLNNLIVSDSERDVFGDALEIFRSKWAKQEGGQFFTDQKVTSMALKFMDFNPYKGDDLVDICAGTGGFLLAGFNQIKTIVDKKKGTEQDVLDIASKCLKGQEIDTEVAELGNSTLLARSGKYVDEIIQSGNSLDINTFGGKSGIKPNSHLCAATNPPFGAKITIKDSEILKNFELSKISNTKSMAENGTANYFRRSPDVLFIEQNLNLLKPGKGRLAIVVPYQIISGPQTRYVREWILKNAEIMSVIDLPGETFQPHTGTKTSLLILKRRKTPLKSISDAKSDSKIFMATPRWIGHDRRGNPVYKKTEDGKDSKEILTDFDRVEDAYTEFCKNKDPKGVYEQCVAVEIASILDDELLKLNAQFFMRDNEKKGFSISIKQWDMFPISTMVDRIFCPGRFKRNYVDRYDGAIPFLGGANINQLIMETSKWLGHDDPKLEQLQIKEGWILITRSGTTGIVSTVPKAWNDYAMSEHVIRIIPNESKLSRDYLHLFLKTSYCQNIIAKSVFGSVIDEITPESIGQIEIPIPRNKKLLKNLSSLVSEAEIAKQTSLSNMSEALKLLETSLSN